MDRRRGRDPHRAGTALFAGDHVAGSLARTSRNAPVEVDPHHEAPLLEGHVGERRRARATPTLANRQSTLPSSRTDWANSSITWPSSPTSHRCTNARIPLHGELPVRGHVLLRVRAPHRDIGAGFTPHLHDAEPRSRCCHRSRVWDPAPTRGSARCPMLPAIRRRSHAAGAAGTTGWMVHVAHRGGRAPVGRRARRARCRERAGARRRASPCGRTPGLPARRWR